VISSIWNLLFTVSGSVPYCTAVFFLTHAVALVHFLTDVDHSAYAAGNSTEIGSGQVTGGEKEEEKWMRIRNRR